jgi:hypothetical protein
LVKVVAVLVDLELELAHLLLLVLIMLLQLVAPLQVHHRVIILQSLADLHLRFSRLELFQQVVEPVATLVLLLQHHRRLEVLAVAVHFLLILELVQLEIHQASLRLEAMAHQQSLIKVFPVVMKTV